MRPKGLSTHLKGIFKIYKKWEGNCIKNSFLVQRMFYLFQLDDLKTCLMLV